MDPAKLIQDSRNFATSAVKADNEGNYKVAIFYYIEAAEAIKTALDIDNSLPSALHENAVKYLERAESLHRQCSKLNFIIILLQKMFQAQPFDCNLVYIGLTRNSFVDDYFERIIPSS